MGKYLLMALLVPLSVPALAQDYSTARIVDVRQNEHSLAVGALSGVPVDQYAITVDLDGMRITANYAAGEFSLRNDSGQWVVGSEVQALIFRDRWLELVRPNGKRLRGRIVRREILRAE